MCNFLSKSPLISYKAKPFIFIHKHTNKIKCSDFPSKIFLYMPSHCFYLFQFGNTYSEKKCVEYIVDNWKGNEPSYSMEILAVSDAPVMLFHVSYYIALSSHFAASGSTCGQCRLALCDC